MISNNYLGIAKNAANFGCSLLKTAPSIINYSNLNIPSSRGINTRLVSNIGSHLMGASSTQKLSKINNNINARKNNVLNYCEKLKNRGYITNQLGNIAIKGKIEGIEEPVIFTKHRGLSLEEAKSDNIVGVGLQTNALHVGEIHPSLGHLLNREIFLHRPDVNALIHLHVDDLISYFSVLYKEPFKYISADAAIILGSEPVILPPEINVEADAKLAKEFVKSTSTLIMANHGVTTFGKDISDAYHKLNTIVAEVRRIKEAMIIANLTGSQVNFLSKNEVEELYDLSKKIL